MKKLLKTLVISLLMLAIGCSMVVPVLAASVTSQQAVTWAKSKINVGLDYDGAYGCQCVDLIYYYYTYLGCSSMGGNACDYASNALPSGWKRITVTSGFVPQAGDIAVWKTNHSCGSCNTSWAGHVGIVTSADSVGFNAVNQNYGGTKYCTLNWFYVSALQCVIRPNFTNASLSVTKTVSCEWKVTIPANYQLNLYYGAADANYPSDGRHVNPQSSSYRLTCDQKVTLSDGSVRYRFTSGDGYVVYFKYDSSIMSAVQNHDYVVKETKSATCTSDGYAKSACSMCGAISTQTEAAKGHSYSSVVVLPTSTSQGYTLHTCVRCGDSYKSNYTDPVVVPSYSGTLSIDTVSGNPGDTVAVSVTADADSPIGSLQFDLTYDAETLEVLGVNEKNMECKDAVSSANYSEPGLITYGYASAESVKSGTLLQVVFEIKESAKSGRSLIGLSLTEQAKDDDANIIVFNTSANGGVMIAATQEELPPSVSLRYGDLNGDETVDAQDALFTLQYAVGKWELSEQEIARANVNGDKAINATDALLILQRAVMKLDKFPVEK